MDALKIVGLIFFFVIFAGGVITFGVMIDRDIKKRDKAEAEKKERERLRDEAIISCLDTLQHTLFNLIKNEQAPPDESINPALSADNEYETAAEQEDTPYSELSHDEKIERLKWWK